MLDATNLEFTGYFGAGPSSRPKRSQQQQQHPQSEGSFASRTVWWLGPCCIVKGAMEPQKVMELYLAGVGYQGQLHPRRLVVYAPRRFNARMKELER